MGMTWVGNIDIADITQVYLGNAPAEDGDLAARMRPDDVVSHRQCGIDTSKHRSPVEPAFPDSGVNHFGCIGPFPADLNFLAT